MGLPPGQRPHFPVTADAASVVPYSSSLEKMNPEASAWLRVASVAFV